MEITEKLKERFCKDNNFNIKIFKNATVFTYYFFKTPENKGFPVFLYYTSSSGINIPSSS